MMVNIDSWLNGKYYCGQLKWFALIVAVGGNYHSDGRGGKLKGRQNWLLMPALLSPFQL